MRLQSLEVSGFRGFASKQKFDLSSDATIVVGSNGLGKTSLLDAVHWGLCGRLGRLGGGDDKVLSLYSRTGQARVSLSLSDEDNSITITRVFDGESQKVSAKINGKELKGASATARIFEKLWPDAINANDGEESLSMAMTRSVYLQQDRLRSFLESADDQERFNVISELVGAGSLTDLQTQLEKESRSWAKQTTKFSKEQSPLSDRVESLTLQLKRLEEAAQLGEELRESTWSEWWARTKKLANSVSEMPSPTSANTSSLLDLAIRELQSARDQLRRRRSSLEQTQELVANPPEKPVESITELKREFENALGATKTAKSALKIAREKAAAIRKAQVAAKEEGEQKRALAQLALNLLEEQCPVCQQSYDVEKTRKRLLALVDEQPRAFEASQDEVVDVEAATRALTKAAESETKSKQLLDEAVSSQKTFRRWEKTCEERIAELGVEAEDDLMKQINDLLEAGDLHEQQVKRQITEGEKLSLNLARESAIARVKSTAADLKKAEDELAAQQQLISKRETTTKQIKILIDQLREARSKVAVDKLSEIQPLLQRIFARIDPHPTFRNLKLATQFFRGKGRLDAEIHDDLEGKSSNSPESILSSSQLNALAVSIFLSFNLALPNLPLQAALLDDPIQSLDDINLLGLVDLLRRTKERRQIIVSTHDARFGKLLARKLRPANSAQTTSVIELVGWKRTGPEVSQFSIDADVIPFRLAAM